MRNIKIEKISERENPVLKRKELQVKIFHEKTSTPAKALLQQTLSKELKKDVEHIDIKGIFSSNGKAESLARIFVWEEKKAEDLSKVVKKEEKKKE